MKYLILNKCNNDNINLIGLGHITNIPELEQFKAQFNSTRLYSHYYFVLKAMLYENSYRLKDFN